MKPRSEACERNRDPILQVLRQWFSTPGVVLEIGAGTGQHAVHFARHLPHLDWLPTDREENLAGVEAWRVDANLPNLRSPAKLDVHDARWPIEEARYVFSANTSHIMSWPEVELMFAGIARVLQPEGIFGLYGPFNHAGEFTSDSNRAFDAQLKAHTPTMGLRDDSDLISLGDRFGLALAADVPMPANNRLLVWKKRAP
jgi:ubiquinone/menaquinone biosynthesis C-methylase UbiE